MSRNLRLRRLFATGRQSGPLHQTSKGGRPRDRNPCCGRVLSNYWRAKDESFLPWRRCLAQIVLKDARKAMEKRNGLLESVEYSGFEKGSTRDDDRDCQNPEHTRTDQCQPPGCGRLRANPAPGPNRRPKRFKFLALHRSGPLFVRWLKYCDSIRRPQPQ